MTNTQLLRTLIKNKGVKIGYIAEKMGISRQSLYLKVNGKRAFNQYEIKSLCEVLDINSDDGKTIFFN